MQEQGLQEGREREKKGGLDEERQKKGGERSG